ncbi:hypothetical protein QUF58_09970 [Anaerolineales bacterium HSG24]|nr:hypothetical protein [Anaerolineales bacterium HSG24]
MTSAASQDKLDNEFLVSRGIRVTEPQLMRSGFDAEQISKDISISFVLSDQLDFSVILQNNN